MAVLEYHEGDSWQNTDGLGRIAYYSVSGYPTAKFDGRRQVVGADTGEISVYLNAYYMEMNYYASACTLNIYVDYDSTTRFLKVKARATKVDTFSNAHLRYAIAESYVPLGYPWGTAPDTLWSLRNVVRQMLPDYNGIVIPDSLLIGQSFVDSQTCIVDSTWYDKNCNVVVFVQRDDGYKPVFRSAKSGLFSTWVFGDASRDGIVDISDVVYLMNYLFVHGPGPNPLASGDPTNDCVVDIGDVVYLINFLFVNGPAPLKGCAW